MRSTEPRLGIEFSRFFEKQLTQAPREIRAAFLDALELFRVDPYHEALRNHALKERFADFRSIDVTPDWRAVFKETNAGDNRQRVISFRLLGTHERLYG